MGTKAAISSIRNKQKRQEVFQQVKQVEKQAKRAAQIQRKKREADNPELKAQRLRENVPRTIENTREADETIVDPEDEEVKADQDADAFASFFAEQRNPNVLVTTNKRVSPVRFFFRLLPVHIFFLSKNGLADV